MFVQSYNVEINLILCIDNLKIMRYNDCNKLTNRDAKKLLTPFDLTKGARFSNGYLVVANLL